MAVEISILSGVRQGQRQVLDATKFRAGPDPGYEVYFDPLADSAARDRSVALSLLDDGWYIQSTGQGEVFVNQSAVVGLTRLKSGSIVRMSEFGPEFEFRILARAPAATDRPGAPASAGSAMGASMPVWPAQPAAAAPVSPVAPGPSVGVPPVMPSPVAPYGPSSSVAPAAAQEPARPAASPPSASDSSRLAVMVGGGILACMVLVMLVKVMMTPSVVIVDRDGKPPVDKREKQETGSIVDKGTSGGEDAQKPQEKKEPVTVDPLKARLEGAVLLIQVERSGQFWPFATCSAVSENTVLTSAREALKLGAWLNDRGSGFKGWVTNPATGMKLAVQEARIYAVSTTSDRPTDWLYTNFGLVTVQGTLPKTAELAGPDELAQLAQGKAVHAYCYVHEGDLITPEDHFELKGTAGKILFINVHSDLPGKPRVLGVKADMPKFPLGAPLVNAQGKIVAIYSDPVAEAAADPKGGSPGTENMHYATVVNPGVIDLWLKKSDSSIWVSTATLKIPAADSKTSAKTK
jgi:hypothetical protein